MFIDETWTKTNMAPRGYRLKAKVPQRHWKTMTFMAALRHDRIDALWLLDGPINGERSRICVEKPLVPSVRPGDIVMMDNLGSYKGKAVRGAGAKLYLLPKYSPDPERFRSANRTGLRQAQASPAQCCSAQFR